MLWGRTPFPYDIIVILKLRHLYPYEYRPNLINQCVHSEMRRSRGRLVCRSACAGSTGVTGEWEVVTPCVSHRSPDMMSSLSGRGSTRPWPDGQTDRQTGGGGLLLAPLIYMGFIEQPRNSWVPAQLFKNTSHILTDFESDLFQFCLKSI